jgi:hypothetical protein
MRLAGPRQSKREAAVTQLDLMTWKRACTVIAFPAQKRRGHAFKVAHQLSKARTNKEADWILTRALIPYHERLLEAGISPSVADRQVDDFRKLIFNRCVAIGSKWMPDMDDCNGQGGGAA